MTAIFILLRAKVYFYCLFFSQKFQTNQSISPVRQQLVKNLLFVLVVNVLVKAVWIFFIDRNVQIRVGYSSYGAFQALFNLGIIFQILLDFGLNQYNSKEVASNPERLSVLFSSMLWTRLILTGVYTIVVVALAILLGYRSSEISLLAGVMGIQILNSTLFFLRGNVAALHHFRTDGVLAVIDRLLLIVVCGTLLLLPQYFGQFKIEWFVWSQIICYLIASIIALIVLLKLAPGEIEFSFKPKLIKDVLVKSSPFALLIFLMSVYMRADTVMIERLCGSEGKHQAGIYASAFRLLDVANIFGVMFSGILLPMFAKMLAGKEEIKSTIRLAVNIMMPLAFIASIGALCFGNEIMQLLYHKDSGEKDGLILGLLMASFPAYCLMYIYSTLLTANGNIKLLNKISACIVVLNLLLHWIFITQFQALGASFSVLITEWVVAGTVIIYAHKVFVLPHTIRWLLAHLGFVVSIALVAFLVLQTKLSWEIEIGMFLAIALIQLFLFRFWSVRSIKELLQRKA
ncbi:MAG: oligosaccharide flippase family protein [Chitinophagaceae bacterium]